MQLYLYSGRLDLAATTLADLQLLVAALADESDPVNAATIARVQAKIPPLVQSDTAEPITLYSYDDAGVTLSSWITDAAVTVDLALGLPDAATGQAYSTTTASISGSSRTATLALNTTALVQALTAARRGGLMLVLHIRQSPAGGGETVALLPLTVSPGVIAVAGTADTPITYLRRDLNLSDVASAATARTNLGLGSVDNTADTAKPVSTAQQAALDLKANLASPALTGTPTAPTAAADTATTQIATTAFAKAEADAAQAASQPLNANLTAEAGLTGAADRLSYYTALGAKALATFTSFGRTLLAYADAAACFTGIKQAATTTATGVVELATDAETLAGTDTTRVAPVSSAEKRALLGDMTRRIADSLYSDGVTVNRAVYWALGTAGAVAAMPVSLPFEFDVPTSNPTANSYLSAFADGLTGTEPKDRNNGLSILHSTAGSLIIRENGASAAADTRTLAYTGFRAAYSGLRVRGVVVFASPDSTTAPVVYVHGVDITASFTPGTTGTPPNWVHAAMLTTYSIAFTPAAGRFIPHAPILGALTAAEVLEWTQTGRLPSWCEVGTGSAVAQTSGTLTIGWKYRISAYVASDVFTNVGAASNATGVEFVATGTTPTTWTNSSSLLKLGPIIKPVIQPIPVLADNGANKIAGILTSGVTPITEKRDWVIQASTNTNGNQQLLGAAVFTDATKHAIDDWCMNTAGTPTVTAGSASAGTQYKASGALAATRNLITLVTRVLASTALWCGSNDTSTIQHTVRGHLVD